MVLVSFESQDFFLCLYLVIRVTEMACLCAPQMLVRRGHDGRCHRTGHEVAGGDSRQEDGFGAGDDTWDAVPYRNRRAGRQLGRARWPTACEPGR